MEKVLLDIFKPSPEALLKLQIMLENGSEIAKNVSSKPKDGDAIWDTVIWWHTQLVNSASNVVLIHFLVSHYISQYVNLKLWDTYWFKQKDDFLLLITDILMYSSGNDEIYDVWRRPKSQWWLWWINEKQAIYFK